MYLGLPDEGRQFLLKSRWTERLTVSNLYTLKNCWQCRLFNTYFFLLCCCCGGGDCGCCGGVLLVVSLLCPFSFFFPVTFTRWYFFGLQQFCTMLSIYNDVLRPHPFINLFSPRYRSPRGCSNGFQTIQCVHRGCLQDYQKWEVRRFWCDRSRTWTISCHEHPLQCVL